jgi:DegV family protein with EDD domain
MVQVLTGPRFVRAVRAGALAVVRQQEAINRINVFPVPDADTGTNLASTLRVAAEKAGSPPPLPVGLAVRSVADAALEGARGNSGAIMAQFFHGLAESMGHQVKANVAEFASAVRRAVEAAQQAMAKPVEGTILSVLKAWAEEVEAAAREGVKDFGELLSRSLLRARQALARTTEQLEVLRKNKVVDAGAQGFVCFLEGVVAFFRDRRAADIRQVGLSLAATTPFAAAHAEMDTTYRFCSEALVVGQQLDRKAITALVQPLGDSLVVAGGGSRVRIHLHTNEPQRLFGLLATVGKVERTKIEDMILQQATNRSPYRVGLVTDSSCDLPESTFASLHVVRVPLHILFGEESFADGVEITPAQFYQRLAESPIPPRTSQPAVGDYRRVFRQLLERHEGVVCVTLSSGLSGTYQAALAAAKEVDPQRIRVVDSKGLSVTLGLVMEAVVEKAKSGAGLEEVAEAAREASAQTALFAAIPSLATAAKSGRVSPGLARLTTLFRLRPILTLDEAGKAAKAGITLGFGACLRGLVKKAKAFAGEARVRLMVAHANAIGAAEYVAEALARAFSVEDIPIVNLSPVLAAHTGPGSVGIAVRRLSPLAAGGSHR